MQKEQAPIYVLGHSDPELQRLIDQSRYYGEFTEQFLRNAGIQAGMRVLDVGCGAGDVSILAAGLVGTSGTVLGIDKSPQAIALARRRATDAQLSQITFREDDLENLSQEEPFDAVIGRFVLLYFADPAIALRKMAEYVRPGGIVAFQEMDMSACRTVPEAPLNIQGVEWIKRTFQKAGVEIDMGSKLYSTFTKAGLPGPQMNLQSRIGGGPDLPDYKYGAYTISSLLPMMERLGVATAEEVDVDTLADRLRDEMVAGGGVTMSSAVIGAWTRKPA